MANGNGKARRNRQHKEENKGNMRDKWGIGQDYKTGRE